MLGHTVLLHGWGILYVLGVFRGIGGVWGSAGDTSQIHRRCWKTLTEKQCADPALVANYYASQPLSLKLTRWDCIADAKYYCMWETVHWFDNHGYKVPQFHGKWPFVRVVGLQEPASVVFSILNMLAFLYMLRQVLKIPHDAPFARLWLCYSLLGIFTWICSTIFHARDTEFTEMMDYFCAFASVLFGCYASFVRIFAWNRYILQSFFSLCFLAFFANHIGHLYFVSFDYGYNMKVNVVVGITNSLSWLLWCMLEWGKGRRGDVWPCVLVILCANAALTLELGDFPPLWWTLDAHALWHLATVPLPLFWTKFVVRDCNYMLAEELKIKKYP